MKKRIKAWTIVESLKDELERALDEGDFELVPGVCWDLLFRALLYALRASNQKVRETWPHLKPRIPKLTPPLARDYTKLFVRVKDLDKQVRYSEDEWEVESEEIEEIAREALDFIADVRKVAIQKGDAS